MSYWLGLQLFLLMALLQASAMPSFSPLGATPNVLLIFSACWLAVRGQREAMVLLPLGTIFYDALSAGPIGGTAIALAPLILLSNGNDDEPSSAHLTTTLLLVAAGTLVYHIMDGIITAALGEETFWLTALAESWLPSMLVNTVLTPAFFVPLWSLNRAFQRRRTAMKWNG